MQEIAFRVNGRLQRLELDPSMPLLWVLRDRLGLTGTKYGCGIARCGVCTVHLDGEPVYSCCTPVSAAANREVMTIEGLSADLTHPLLLAWIAEDVPQCGFCQPGQLMTAAALLAQDPAPDDERIEQAMSRVLCRCGTYLCSRRALRRALEAVRSGQP
jgi:aerobic-type carbon monoxide dehydrogenase small subunit (CoxS/CutS family)